jgi:small subunit ribosomal protein S6
MNDYEILLMLDPETPEERHTEIITRTRELVEKGGGKWLSHDAWGRRRLAYEIDHKADGVYHQLQFDVQPATLDEVTRVLKITDGVMRHMATRRVKGGGRTAPPPPLPAIEPERERDREAPRPEREAAPEPEAETEPEAEPPAEEPLSGEVQDGSVGAEPQPGSDSASEYAAPTESEPEGGA